MDEDDDLEMLRQAALKTLGMNKKKKETSNHSRNRRSNTSHRVKTNGNLIEIQPSELTIAPGSHTSLQEDTIPQDYIVEEFVLDGSDVSINSSDCDEVEEVIVSESEETEDALIHDKAKDGGVDACDGDTKNSKQQEEASLHNNDTSDDESDAVSIKSSYSLIMDEDDNEFQSLESKFLSRKLQKPKMGEAGDGPSAGYDASGSKRSRSPLPFRSSKLGRRSRSRSRDRDRGGRSRSPLQLMSVRRRNHSPPTSTSRGGRRTIRTNSHERRRRRTRSRSPTSRSSPPSSRNRLGVENSRRQQKSRSGSPANDDKSKRQRSSSHTRPKSPVIEKLLDKVEKCPPKNITRAKPEEVERLEKRRKKFEGESEIHSSRKVIKTATSSKLEKQVSDTKNSSTTGRPKILKEKVQKTTKRKIEGSTVTAKEEDDNQVTKMESRTDREEAEDEDTKTSGEDQEDLRTRLIKKKLEKMQHGGSSSTASGSSSSSAPLSSVVVVMGSQRIFSQALKNSQLLDSDPGGSVKAKGSNHKGHRSSPSRSITSTSKSSSSKGPKSEVKINTVVERSITSKRLQSSSSKQGSSSSNVSGKHKSSGPKRVVSLTYS